MSFLGDCKKQLLIGFSPIWRSYLLLRGVRVGNKFTCIGRPAVNLGRGGDILLGNAVTLCNSGMANPLAEYGRCRLATVASGARIILHDNVGLSSCLICAATLVEVGEGTIIGGGAMILDTDFHPRGADGNWLNDPQAVSRAVRIGKRCFIGSRAIVLKGVTMGDGCVVGAGAVVTKNIEAYTIVAGNPATVVGKVQKFSKTSTDP
jgi:acetyltransferase-like isoleucine patch superfamily enzyme